jgi:CheY-like chemotaxis protein
MQGTADSRRHSSTGVIHTKLDTGTAMNKKILLVDDNKLFLEIEKEFLEFTKTEVLTAHDGLEALKITKDGRPDLIFMDLEMARMDGATSCRAIKEDPVTALIPVVMVTSRYREEDRDRCYSSGCDDFISKPLDRDIFLGVARRFIPDIDRREQRHKARLKASIRIRNEAIPCMLNDISLGGAFVVSDFFGMPGSVVQLSFSLPDVTVDCPGRIAWVNREDGANPKGFGVKFALMDKRMKAALQDFLARAETSAERLAKDRP